MNINIARFDQQHDRPSIRVSYDSSTQCHLVHRDFHGPFGTLVRVCLLQIPDEYANDVTHYFEALCACGRNIGGYVRLRFNAESRHLINCIANRLQGLYETRRGTPQPPLWPSPSDPCLPDTEEVRDQSDDACTLTMEERQEATMNINAHARATVQTPERIRERVSEAEAMLASMGILYMTDAELAS